GPWREPVDRARCSSFSPSRTLLFLARGRRRRGPEYPARRLELHCPMARPAQLWALSSFAIRAIHKLTPMIMIDTTEMVSVASTLISGLTPRRTLENTTMGRVLLPGPEVKLEITRSSQDRVKASSQPERMAGNMMGSVMTKNT